MIVWIKKEVVKAATDQRADVVWIDTHEIGINLCGTGQKQTVRPHDLCGVELTTGVQLMFDVTGHRVTVTDL